MATMTALTTSTLHDSPSLIQQRDVAPGMSTSQLVITHGLLMTVAFAFMFPLGSALPRILKFRGAIWAHGIWQIVALILGVVGLAFGVLFIRRVGKYATHHHPVLGMVVLALLLLQPLSGAIAHSRFKQSGRNRYSAVHRWVGRIVLLAGIINGGLGIQLKGNEKPWMIGYIVPAVVFTAIWFGVSLNHWIRTRKQTNQPGLEEKPLKRESDAS